VAKPKRKSQTYVVNATGEVLSYLALGVITYADDLKGVVPDWAYIAIILACFTYNRWRRTKTDEAIE
jgi:hypothetical protein